MNSFRDVLGLYRLAPEEVVSETAGLTNSSFSPEGIPVLICAYNEERDLPVTLAGLARSDVPVQPYVVDNASSDRTADFAEKMGAVIIEEQTPAKLFALKTGIGYLATKEGRLSMLLTDADTIVQKPWARLTDEALGKTGELSVVAGSAVFHRIGESEPHYGVKALHAALTLAKHYAGYLAASTVHGRGHNMGISFDSHESLEEAINLLNTNLITRDDTELASAIVKINGADAHLIDPRTIVLTRGDRIPDTESALRALRDERYRKGHLYKDWFDRAGFDEPVV